MDHAKVAHQIREKIAEFSGKVSQGLPKTGRRMVREVLYGVQNRASVRLSEIARSLDEQTSMRKVIERLSRQLNRERLRLQVRVSLLFIPSELITLHLGSTSPFIGIDDHGTTSKPALRSGNPSDTPP